MARIRRRIGDILVDAGLVTREQLEQAVARSNGRKRVGEILVELGLVTEEQIARALSAQFHLPFIDLRKELPHPRSTALIPEHLARSHRLIPVRLHDRALVVAMADPTDVLALDAVRRAVHLEVIPAVAPESQIIDAIHLSYGLQVPQEVVMGGPGHSAESPGLAVRILDFLLSHAVQQRATDIHIEPEVDVVRIRYRIDGILYGITTLPQAILPGLITRLKVLTRLDVAEQRLPQDGAFEADVNGRTLDVRVAFIPTLHGEMATLRLLDRNRQVLSLEELGMRDFTRRIYEQLVRRPYGLILVSGPTGSGKSTTLASTLVFLNTGLKKIVSIEDPVEYRLPMVNQIQVNPDAGLDFPTGLRSLLRHDPDIIMVGEIRDPETARIATHAALAGSLVLATIHTNDAPTALLRLAQMGVPPYLIASAATGVLSQRLVRLLCSYCKEQLPHQPDDPLQWIEKVSGELPPEGEELPTPRLSVPRGCKRCRLSGYLGRTGIFEVLPITKSIQELILQGAPQKDIAMQARAEGMRSMIVDGAIKVLGGLTTMEEVRRVTELGDLP